MPDAAGDVDNDSSVQLDFFVVEDHGPLAGNDVIEFVGPLVVVQLGVLDFDVVDFASGAVFFLDQAADLPTSFRPGVDFGRVSTEKLSCGSHDVSWMRSGALSCGFALVGGSERETVNKRIHFFVSAISSK
jgi:hypothetical protein